MILIHRWEQRTNSHGYTYFVDHNTRTTSWHRPTTDRNYLKWRERDLLDQRHRHQQRFLLVRAVLSSSDNVLLMMIYFASLMNSLRIRICQKTGVSHTGSVLSIYLSNICMQGALYKLIWVFNLKIILSYYVHWESLLVCITEMRHLPNDKPYFVNHKSRTTQWEDPRVS